MLSVVMDPRHEQVVILPKMTNHSVNSGVPQSLFTVLVYYNL
jgi:hypothetical protein